jgi:hypothetical protein
MLNQPLLPETLEENVQLFFSFVIGASRAVVAPALVAANAVFVLMRRAVYRVFVHVGIIHLAMNIGSITSLAVHPGTVSRARVRGHMALRWRAMKR